MDKDDRIAKASFLDAYEGQTLREAIKGIASENGISGIFAAERIYEEIESENYRLVDGNPPENILRYFFSFYNIRFWIIISYLGLTIYSTLALPYVYPLFYIRYFCTLLLTLIIPGYLIMDVILTDNFQKESLLKIGLGVIVSFLLVSIIGYILISSRFGLRETSLTISLIIVTTILSLIWSVNKYLRRNTQNED